jgi:hypothetical protein
VARPARPATLRESIKKMQLSSDFSIGAWLCGNNRAQSVTFMLIQPETIDSFFSKQ